MQALSKNHFKRSRLSTIMRSERLFQKYAILAGHRLLDPGSMVAITRRLHIIRILYLK